MCRFLQYFFCFFFLKFFPILISSHKIWVSTSLLICNIYGFHEMINLYPKPLEMQKKVWDNTNIHVKQSFAYKSGCYTQAAGCNSNFSSLNLKKPNYSKALQEKNMRSIEVKASNSFMERTTYIIKNIP